MLANTGKENTVADGAEPMSLGAEGPAPSSAPSPLPSSHTWGVGRDPGGMKHQQDKNHGQQYFSVFGSFYRYDILQTSSAGKAPANSLETRLLLKC